MSADMFGIRRIPLIRVGSGAAVQRTTVWLILLSLVSMTGGCGPPDPCTKQVILDHHPHTEPSLLSDVDAPLTKVTERLRGSFPNRKPPSNFLSMVLMVNATAVMWCICCM